jgi:hypothetical protein
LVYDGAKEKWPCPSLVLSPLCPLTAQDDIDGVSECIILGVPVHIGTGLFKLVRR